MIAFELSNIRFCQTSKHIHKARLNSSEQPIKV